MFDGLKSMFSTTPAPEAVAFPKFSVPMPEAGHGAYLLFSIKEMEALDDALGAEYWAICELGFRHPAPAIISRALAVCLHGAEPDGAPWGLSIQEICRRLYDAQLRSMRGITLAEAEAAIEEASP